MASITSELSKPAADPGLVSAINQMFAEFELVYHNQYHKAFSTREKEEWAKKLWYNNLKEYGAAAILDAAHRAIKESEYLPTVRGVLKYLEKDILDSLGLPDPHAAFMEACNAPHPKMAFSWSHPAVYHAGVQCGWLFLESSPERVSWPVFEDAYRSLCARVRLGEKLELPLLTAQEAPAKTMSREERLKALEKLRASTHL